MHTYTRHYRTFRQYFNKNRRTYTFEIKFLNLEPDDAFMQQSLKPLLKPLDLINVSKPVKSYLHENPVEFPLEPFGIIWSFEIELGMSANAEELKTLFFEALQLPLTSVLVYNINDPARQAKKEYQDLQHSLLDNYAKAENDYKIPRLGYDMDDETIQAQDLVGSSRIKSLMDTMTSNKEEPPKNNFLKSLEDKD